MPVWGRCSAVSRDPHRGYKTTGSPAASTVTETELNLEAVLQINCLLLWLSFVFLPRTWWLLSLVLLPVTSPIFIPLYPPYLDTFLISLLSHSDRAPKLLIKHCKHPIVTMLLIPKLVFLMEAYRKNVFLGSQQELTMRHEKSKQDSTRSCFLLGALSKADQFCRAPSCLVPLPRFHFSFSSFFTLLATKHWSRPLEARAAKLLTCIMVRISP